MDKADPYRIPSLAKSCQLLQLVSQHQGEWNASELARALKIPRTTCFRMLQTLVLEKFIEADGSSYRIGPGLVRLGLQTLEGMPIRRLCVPILRDLGRALGETVHLAILCDDRSLLLEVCDAGPSARVASRPGTLVFLHASSTGKALLAGLPEDRRKTLVARLELAPLTTKTLATPKALLAELKAVAKQGYAVDDGEYTHAGRCLAVPVRDAAGAVVAAIGTTSSVERLPLERIAATAARMQESARALTAQLAVLETRA